MDRMSRIRRGVKGEMVKRGRGKEKGSGLGASSSFYPFTLLPSSPFLFILSILPILLDSSPYFS
jgi:hypothetical protein